MMARMASTMGCDGGGGPKACRISSSVQPKNGLADAVKFFHLDALGSAVRLKIDFDVTLTEVARGLYWMLGRPRGRYESGRSPPLFPPFLTHPAAGESNRQ